MRLTMTTKAVLRVLAAQPSTPMYGLEIGKASHLPSGTLYPILARLEREGWLESGWEDVDPSTERRPRRRYYHLTTLGQRQVADLIPSNTSPGMLAW
jgi:PadR family transcriptional regulator PadR